jgi:hypothetical protein
MKSPISLALTHPRKQPVATTAPQSGTTLPQKRCKLRVSINFSML